MAAHLDEALATVLIVQPLLQVRHGSDHIGRRVDRSPCQPGEQASQVLLDPTRLLEFQGSTSAGLVSINSLPRTRAPDAVVQGERVTHHHVEIVEVLGINEWRATCATGRVDRRAVGQPLVERVAGIGLVLSPK
jgi:hypothetical protein